MMNAMPSTVPGMPEANIVIASNAPLPMKYCRASKYAVTMARAAESGAAAPARLRVLNSDGQATPLHTRPPEPNSMAKAVA